MGIFTGFGSEDRLAFTKHLSVMIKSGIPILEAVSTLKDQASGVAQKQILSGIYSEIANGQLLSEALKKHGRGSFDPFYINLVKVSEESGTMDTNLDFLALQLAKDLSVKKKIQSAMMYPALVFLATTIMGGFIALFILPKLVDFFSAFEMELPLSTRVLLFVANLMADWGILLFVGFFIVGVGLVLTIRSKHVLPYWHAFLLKIPLFGKLVRYGELARFSRNFGILLQSGVPVARAIEVTGQTLTNHVFIHSVSLLAKGLSEGTSLNRILSKNGFSEFPKIAVKMIAVGEKTGKLDESLLYLGDFFEEEIDGITKNLTTVLEPILLLTIGLVVAFVAMAIISPIYQLTGNIGR